MCTEFCHTKQNSSWGFLGPLLHSILCRTVLSEIRGEVWEPPTWGENPPKLRQAENQSIFKVLVETGWGQRNWEWDQNARFFNTDLEDSSRSSFWKCLLLCLWACEKLFRFFYQYWVAARQKPWSGVKNSWVWFLILWLSLDLSFGFSISLSFKWGENETDFVDKIHCGSAMEGELEKLNSGGIIIKVCILRLSLEKIILSGNYFTGVLNDDTLKGRQMRHQN